MTPLPFHANNSGNLDCVDREPQKNEPAEYGQRLALRGQQRDQPRAGTQRRQRPENPLGDAREGRPAESPKQGNEGNGKKHQHRIFGKSHANRTFFFRTPRRDTATTALRAPKSPAGSFFAEPLVWQRHSRRAPHKASWRSCALDAFREHRDDHQTSPRTTNFRGVESSAQRQSSC